MFFCGGVVRARVATLTAVGVILAISSTVASTSQLLCSQCSSGPHGECVTSAPAPTACEQTPDHSQGVNCMTARRIDRNGTLLRFIRGCTMVRVGKGCVQHRDNTSLCYEACHMDNCNQATAVKISMTTVVPFVICILIIFA